MAEQEKEAFQMNMLRGGSRRGGDRDSARASLYLSGQGGFSAGKMNTLSSNTLSKTADTTSYRSRVFS